LRLPVSVVRTFTADDGWYRLLYLTVVDAAGERGRRVERPATP
jgi:hypothetical protein